jgi:hypothetical protein
MITETLFYAELLRPVRTQKFRDHAVGLPGSMTSHAVRAASAVKLRHASPLGMRHATQTCLRSSPDGIHLQITARNVASLGQARLSQSQPAATTGSAAMASLIRRSAAVAQAADTERIHGPRVPGRRHPDAILG